MKRIRGIMLPLFALAIALAANNAGCTGAPPRADDPMAYLCHAENTRVTPTPYTCCCLFN